MVSVFMRPEEPELDGDMDSCASKANSEMVTPSTIHVSTRPTTNRPRMLSGHHFLFFAKSSLLGGGVGSLTVPRWVEWAT